MVSNGESSNSFTLIIMTDPLYSNDFCLDPGISVKQEPYVMDTSSVGSTASVPIPGRRTMDMTDLRDFGFDFDSVHSPSLPDGGVDFNCQLPATPEIYPTMGINSMWSTRLGTTDMELGMKNDRMDDDDIFEVDKADLIQGPTLAELNANDDTLLGDLSFDDLLLPEEHSFCITIPAQKSSPALQANNNNSNTTNNNSMNSIALSAPQTNLGFYKDSFEPFGSIPNSPFDPFLSKTPVTAFSPTSQNSSTSSLVMASTSSPPSVSALQQKHSTLHELLLRRDGYNASPDSLGQSVPGPSSPVPTTGGFVRVSRSHASRLSSSAPTHLGLDQIWQRREPRKHLLSTGSLAEAGSTSSLSTGGVLSPEGHDFSQDEDFDSDDSEHYEDFSSDNDTDDETDDRGSRLSLSSASKKERFFWQYNVQAKGPKGQRLVLKTKLEDPHVLNEVTDPVFSPSCSVRGIKHSGKARKGDGNDLTPNPRKLCNIGKELDKLGRIINDMTPVSELPFNVRPKTRKEKNKLASRACRLKKKAQHEANKIKLFGLENEHKRLITGIQQIKDLLIAKFTCTSAENQDELTKQVDRVWKSATKLKISGNSTEYVNKVIDKVKAGIPGGGLEHDF